MWGKFLNAGQTCVAPDYLYVHASVKDAFIAECRTIIEARYGKTAAEQKASPDLTRIVNLRHAGRVASLLQDAVGGGAKVLTGGDVESPTAHREAETAKAHRG